jgi:hypothetical protein
MISIGREMVPVFLRSSGLFRALDSDDSQLFEIPSSCFKDDTSVISIRDLKSLLYTARYWILDDIPLSALEFLHIYSSDKILLEVGELFPEYEPFFQNVKNLRDVARFDKVNCAIRNQMGLEVVMYLKAKCGIKVDKLTWAQAVISNDVDCLRYLYRCGCPIHPQTFLEAAKHNSYACYKYASESRILYGVEYSQRKQLLRLAASSGALEIMKFIHKKFPKCNQIDKVASSAAMNGHLDCLQFARESGYPWIDALTRAAASGNHLDCLKYCIDQGCSYNKETLDFAASNGALECLVYLNQLGVVQPDCDTCMLAAESGSLHCLKYLHRSGCAWDAYTVRHAATYGHWDCVRYAISHGCPWTAFGTEVGVLYALDSIHACFGIKP